MSRCSEYRRKLFLSTNNSGGDGKTTTTELFETTAVLGGLRCLITDIDIGNRGYLNRSGDTSATTLSWGQHPAFADPNKWYRDHVMNHDVTVIDSGANMMAAGTPINDFLYDICELTTRTDTELIFLAVTSPNKAGSGEVVESIYTRYKSAAKVMIVQNDRDGSKTFKRSLSDLGATIVKIPHLKPGLQALRLNRRIPLHQILQQPEPGYSAATALIAQWVLEFASQPAIQDVFGKAALQTLNELAAPSPGPLLFAPSTFNATRDEVIAANAHLFDAVSAFYEADPSRGDHFTSAAERYWLAYRAFRKALG